VPSYLNKQSMLTEDRSNILMLPDELLLRIFSMLPLEDQRSLACVNKKANRLFHDFSLSHILTINSSLLSDVYAVGDNNKFTKSLLSFAENNLVGINFSSKLIDYQWAQIVTLLTKLTYAPCTSDVGSKSRLSCLHIRNLSVLKRFKKLYDHTTDSMFLPEVFTLSLLGYDISHSDLALMAKFMSSNTLLSVLSLRMCSNFGPEEVKYIAQALMHPNLKLSILKIDFDSNNILTEGALLIAKAISAQTKLTELDLDVGFNNISEEGIRVLVNSISGLTGLKKLILKVDRNHIGSTRTMVFHELTPANFKIVDLSIDLRKSYLGVEQTRGIAQYISSHMRLAKLCLNIDMTKIGAIGAKILAIAICDHPRLTTLSLDSGLNEINDNGAKLFGKAILSTPKFIFLSLDFTSNQISTEGIKFISQAIVACINLTQLKLYLSSNKIDYEGCKILFNAITNHPSIVDVVLDVSDNKILQDEVMGLIGIILNSSSIRLLNIRGSGSVSSFSIILNPPNLYKLLLRKLSLTTVNLNTMLRALKRKPPYRELRLDLRQCLINNATILDIVTTILCETQFQKIETTGNKFSMIRFSQTKGYSLTFYKPMLATKHIHALVSAITTKPKFSIIQLAFLGGCQTKTTGKTNHLYRKSYEMKIPNKSSLNIHSSAITKQTTARRDSFFNVISSDNSPNHVLFYTPANRDVSLSS